MQHTHLLQRLCHRTEQHFDFIRFANKRLAGLLEKEPRFGIGVITGHEYESTRDVRHVTLDLFKERASACIRESQVADDTVDLLVSQGVVGVQAVGDGQHAVTQAFEELGDDDTIGGVVFHQKNMGWSLRYAVVFVEDRWFGVWRNRRHPTQQPRRDPGAAIDFDPYLLELAPLLRGEISIVHSGERVDDVEPVIQRVDGFCKIRFQKLQPSGKELVGHAIALLARRTSVLLRRS